MNRFLALLLFFLPTATAYTQHYLVKPAFELNEGRAIVEGMTFDPAERNFYFGNAATKRILKYSEDGKPLGKLGSENDGLTSVLGMNVDVLKHHLWVCGATKANDKSIMTVFHYDLKTGELIGKYPDTSLQAKLFNDVAITSDGNVYVTDSYTRCIYTVDKSAKCAVVYVRSDSLRDANGITTDGRNLFVSTYPGVTMVDTRTKKITALRMDHYHIAGCDGLYFYKNSLIGVQNVFYPPTVVRYYLNDAFTKIEKGQLISAAHPSFVVPTTGAVAGNIFYMMSNNNVGLEKEPKLQKVRVVKISL